MWRRVKKNYTRKRNTARLEASRVDARMHCVKSKESLRGTVGIEYKNINIRENTTPHF